MNHSIYSADRMTHLKIVVVALVAGIAVAGFGISAVTMEDDMMMRSWPAAVPADTSLSVASVTDQPWVPSNRLTIA